MTPFSVLKAHLISADVGLMQLVMLCLVSSAIVFFLWHRVPAWRRLFRVSFLGIPAFVGLVTYPLVGVVVLAGMWVIGNRALPNFLVRKISADPSKWNWLLIGVLVLALVIRLPRMGESLWYDESFSVQLVSLPFSNFGPALLADVHPPVYYGLLGTALRLFGMSPAAARLPSLVFGLLSVWLAYRLANIVFGDRRIALVAALLIAVSPAAAYYSIEARSYAMLTCEIFGMALCVLEKRPRWLGLLMALTCWTHNFGYFYGAVFSLIVVVKHWRGWLYALRNRVLRDDPAGHGQTGLWWLFALLVGAVGAVAWLPFMLAEAGTVSDGYWMYFSPGSFFQPFISMTVGVLPTSLVLVVLIPILLVMILAVVRLTPWLRLHKMLWLYGVIFGAPGLAMLVSFLWHPVFLARGVLPSMQLLLVLVAGLTGLVSGTVVKKVLLVIFSFGLVAFYTYEPRPPYQALLQEYCGQYDAPLYHTSLTTAFVSAHAYRPDLPQLDWPDAKDQGDTFDPSANGIYGFHTGALEELKGYKQVCLMQMVTPLSKPEELAYIDGLLAKYPHQTSVVGISEYFELHFHLLEVGL